jgi:hypothetical protein
MTSQDQIAARNAAGADIRQKRDTHDRLGRCQSPDAAKQLREQAAKTAAVCADCFAPLPADASVTLVGRFIEHVPGSYNGIGQFLQPYDRYLSVPICLSCWLRHLQRPWWGEKNFRGTRQNAPLDRAEPVEFPYKLRRRRCEACARPLRVVTKIGGYLPLRDRWCCETCFDRALLNRANERRRVRHGQRPCMVCGTPFIPKKSTAKTCSNRCRQRLFRQR